MGTEYFDLLNNVYDNIYPLYFKIWLLLFGFCVIFSMTGKIKRSDDLSLFSVVTMALKKWCLPYFFALTLLSVIALSIYAFIDLKFNTDMVFRYLSLCLSKIEISYRTIMDLFFVLMLPYAILFIYKRYFKPRISAFIRRFRVSQTGDALSDIRLEHGKYKPKTFTPSDYYQTDKWFIGLNEESKPVWIDNNEFCTTNIRILGATQTGKGILQGVIIDQCIRKKEHAVCFIDQKPDKFIYSIMKQACSDTNRNFIVFDVTANRGITYEPFLYGERIDKLSRIYNTLDINDTGTTADHYLENARACILKVYDLWDGTIQNLKDLLSGTHEDISEEDNEHIAEFGKKVTIKLDELASLPGTGSSGKLLNIHEIVEKGDILYIRGKINSDLVKRLVKCAIQEMTDAFIATPDKTGHYTCVIDEARFVISPEIADAMATVVSSRANIILAYQEADDLLNIKGYSSAIAASVKSSIETNSNILIVQQCKYKTAEELAQQSGTIPLTITRLEHVDTDDFGAESWGGKRLIGQQEEYYIPVNTMLSLPPRVGVLKTISSLSQIIFSCWVKMDKLTALPDIVQGRTPEPARKKAGNREASPGYIPDDGDKNLVNTLSGNTIRENKHEKKKHRSENQ